MALLIMEDFDVLDDGDNGPAAGGVGFPPDDPPVSARGRERGRPADADGARGLRRLLPPYQHRNSDGSAKYDTVLGHWK